MVVAVKPGRFYGSSLPRPRIYTDVKLNKERVDPPMPVLEPFLSWANEAHWSMGGLSFKRHRLQGRIEGRIQKLRAATDDHREEPKRKQPRTSLSPVAEEEPTHRNTRQTLAAALDSSSESEDGEAEREAGSDDDALGRGSGVKRKRARKLSDEFDKVASAAASPRAEKGGTKKSASVSLKAGKGEKKKSAYVSPPRAEKRGAKKSTSVSSRAGMGEKKSVSVSPPRVAKGRKKRSSLGEQKMAVASRVQTRRSDSGGETPRADLNGNGRRTSPRKTKHN